MQESNGIETPKRLGADGELEMFANNDKTSGDWKTEEDAARDFDCAVEASGLFRIHREIWGHYLHVRPGCDVEKRPRIDRILVPNQAANALGWDIGSVGVELKRSGAPLPICQALNYSCAIWELPNGHCIWLRWVFLFPKDRVVGTLASAMVGNCIGTANVVRGQLKLKTDQTNVLAFWQDVWTFKSPPCGKKLGSR
jgi:hypothetical protein